MKKVTHELADRFNLLLQHRVLVCVSPVDTWDEWSWQVVVEDCMSPFCTIEFSQPTDPYPTFALALEAGIIYAETLTLNQQIRLIN